MLTATVSTESKSCIYIMRVSRFLLLVFSALGLTPGMAHLVELAPKLAYDAHLYASVTSTLYRLYGPVFGPIQVGALALSAIVCWMVRRDSRRNLCLAALISFGASLSLWALVVQPVNVAWAAALSQDPAAADSLYTQLRSRWEFGHVVAFAAWFVGFVCVVAAEVGRQSPSTPEQRGSGL